MKLSAVNRPYRSLAAAALLAALAACSSSAPPTSAAAPAALAAASAPAGAAGAPRGGPRHIFFIMMENHATDEIIGNTADAPFINQLAGRYGVATSYYGVTHPSLPNYLAALSGDFQGIWDDCKAGADVTCAPEEFVPGSGDATSALLLTPAEVASASATPHWFSGRNLVDQLEESGRSWKAYMQSIPGVGSDVEYAPVIAGSPVKLYAQKHDPFMYFADIRNSPARMQRIVPLDALDADLAGGTPDFVWISPDQCHDMHGMSPAMATAVGLPDCGYPASGLDHKVIALGDAFLEQAVGKIMASPAWREDSVLVIAWDEDDYAGFAGCCGSPTGTGGGILGGARAPAIVITSREARHQVSTHPYNHYTLLGTIQRLWDLGCLAHSCDFGDADLMTRLFDPDEGGEAPRLGKNGIDHVLLLSVDGLHEKDLARFVAAHPGSALARLARDGKVYTGAHTTTPSDSFPGLLALTTGGTPRSTGVYYDDSYDRTLFPPGSACAGSPGTEVVYDETVDFDLTQLFSGGMNPANLPLSAAGGACTPVPPHAFLQVNTIFEVVKAAGGRTAWSDKHPTYDLLNGPSGTGVDDLYTPEINSNISAGGTVQGVNLAATLAACDGTNSLPPAKVAVYTDCGPAVEAYDDVKVQAVLNELGGRSADGTASAPVPALLGMNFQEVSVSQKLPVGGYADASGTPSALLEHALAHTDASIGRMVAQLRRHHLLSSTLIVVTAKHGQSPIDLSKLAMEGGGHAPDETVQDPLTFVNLADPTIDATVFTNDATTGPTLGHTYATTGHVQTDDVGIVWLQDQSSAKVAAVVTDLQGNAAAMHASVLPPDSVFSGNISSGAALAALFGDPTSSDPVAAARAPNVFIQPDAGVIYSGSSKKIAEHGGGAPDDTGVALLVSGPGLRGGTVSLPVSTTQVAPTILEALGLDPYDLRAVRIERTRSLPAIPWR